MTTKAKARQKFTLGTPYQFDVFDGVEDMDCWWCDVVDANGETVYAAGPASDAEQARWIALDWVNDAFGS